MKYICTKITNGMIMRFDFYNSEFFKHVLSLYKRHIIKGPMYSRLELMFRNAYIMAVYGKNLEF